MIKAQVNSTLPHNPTAGWERGNANFWPLFSVPLLATHHRNEQTSLWEDPTSISRVFFQEELCRHNRSWQLWKMKEAHFWGNSWTLLLSSAYQPSSSVRRQIGRDSRAGETLDKNLCLLLHLGKPISELNLLFLWRENVKKKKKKAISKPSYQLDISARHENSQRGNLVPI